MRFKSTVQEIDPQHTLSNSPPTTDEHVGEVTPEDIKALSKSLQGNQLQERRMNIFSFEAYSLPASRVCLTPPPMLVMLPHTLLGLAPFKPSALSLSPSGSPHGARSTTMARDALGELEAPSLSL